MKAGILFAVVMLSSFFAQANSGRHYKMACLVATPDAGRILAHETIAPSSGEEVSIYKNGNLEMIAGATETMHPNGPMTTQIQLTITDKGDVIARTLADFDPDKSGNVILWSSDENPSFSCTSVPERD